MRHDSRAERQDERAAAFFPQVCIITPAVEKLLQHGRDTLKELTTHDPAD